MFIMKTYHDACVTLRRVCSCDMDRISDMIAMSIVIGLFKNSTASPTHFTTRYDRKTFFPT